MRNAETQNAEVGMRNAECGKKRAIEGFFDFGFWIADFGLKQVAIEALVK